MAHDQRQRPGPRHASLAPRDERVPRRDEPQHRRGEEHRPRFILLKKQKNILVFR